MPGVNATTNPLFTSTAAVFSRPSATDRRHSTLGSTPHPTTRRTADLTPPAITEEALAQLQAYPWPGNIRQLEHILQRAMISSRGQCIQPEHLDLEHALETKDIRVPDREEGTIVSLDEYERRYLSRVLRTTDGVIHGHQGAARLLKINPTTLRSRLIKLDLSKDGGLLN